ncbi:MAG: hypothetical protein ED559_06915 [Phycisphaera sp.]|nr:MAG: hypothetical protein ED559_06915 [Phycisphaera sp.]
MTSRGRAFTVIELLIVVALMLAVGCLVIVSGFAWSEKERVEAAEKGISASVEEARAMALRLGRPVRLVATSYDTGSTRLSLEPWEDAFDSDQLESDETSSKAQAIYELPDGLSIAHSEEGDSFFPHETDVFVQAESVPISLLDVYPDGQAKLSDELWQLESAGAVHVPSLDSWAGTLRFEAVELDEFADFAGVPADEEPSS